MSVEDLWLMRGQMKLVGEVRNGWWAEKDLRLVVSLGLGLHFGMGAFFLFLMIWTLWWPPKPCLVLNCLEQW